MEKRLYPLLLFLVTLIILTGCVETEDTEITEDNGIELEEVAEGLDNPWSIEFVPETDHILVTERPGDLAIVDESDGSVEYIEEGLPDVDNVGQGGMLDVEVHPEFSENDLVYLTYSSSNEEGVATHLGRGTLDIETMSLQDFEVLHVAEPFVEGGSHFGSRITFDEDNYVYFTTGDRGDKDFGPEHVSQDLSNELGATIRLEDDGSIPEDNPFYGEEYRENAIYSYGHRNSQGMTTHPDTGKIWQSEHGEEDGDEINILEKGGNYGWPVTHYGCHYGTDEPVAEDPHENPDVVNPVFYWECNTGGFPPAGITFYTGEHEEWDGDLFVGGLASRYLARFNIEETDDEIIVTEEEPLLEEQGWRVRDVEQNEENLYVIIDDSPAPIVRLTPE